MFFDKQDLSQQGTYIKFLQIAWWLSNLYSESDVPYLYYRVAEKIFCRAFGAIDLSRSDVSADAKKWDLWIWLKTFLLWNNKTFQKVAEFNSDRNLYSYLTPEELVKKVSELRNNRIEFTENIHELGNSIYHCILRESWKFKIFEESMDKIDINNIKHIKKKENSILFDDWINEYSFLISKSTLTKRFSTDTVIQELEIDIIKDPLIELEKLLNNIEIFHWEKEQSLSTIYLPLYWKDHTVFEKSWLNQWNAGGRARDVNEVYIPIPAEINKKYSLFFPPRDQPFSLILPNNKTMRAKVCQENNKALMSYSNKELWQRILRDILKLKEWELLTYEKLQLLWIDSVRIDKIWEWQYEINFAKTGSYDSFRNTFDL